MMLAASLPVWPGLPPSMASAGQASRARPLQELHWPFITLEVTQHHFCSILSIEVVTGLAQFQGKEGTGSISELREWQGSERASRTEMMLWPLCKKTICLQEALGCLFPSSRLNSWAYLLYSPPYVLQLFFVWSLEGTVYILFTLVLGP